MKHEFDGSLTPDLSWEQRYWLVSALRLQLRGGDYPYGMRNRFKAVNELANRLAFYVNSHCPDGKQLDPGRVLEILAVKGSVESLLIEDPFRKYSLWVQLMADPWFTFMNYGYYSDDYEKYPIRLVGVERNWKFAAQFYHRVANQVDLKAKDVLEVGSGRGGGAAFVSRRFKPRIMVGLDGTQSNTLFCRSIHQTPRLHFVAGRAEKLPFVNGSFDVVLNIESLTYYRPLGAFLSGVHRVLRPNGAFLVAIYGSFNKMFKIRQKILNAGFSLVRQEDVSTNVRTAIALFKRDHLPRIIRENKTLVSKSVYEAFFLEAYSVDTRFYYCFAFRKI